MEATIVYWGSIGIMENELGTTGIIGVLLERHFLAEKSSRLQTL